MKEIDAKTATVEGLMRILDLPREEAEDLLRQLRGEFEPDIIMMRGRPEVEDN